MSPEEKKPSYNDADFSDSLLLKSLSEHRMPPEDNTEKGPRMNLETIAAEQKNL